MPELTDSPEEIELEKLEVLDRQNVTDEAEGESPESARFSITSYGADYTVDSLVKRVQSGAFFVPPFQRLYVWNQKQASKFIESLLMGLPVPGIFVFRQQDTNKHLIIDGQQRLKTLSYFYEGVLREKRFRLHDIRKPWAGKTYKELSDEDRRILDDSIIHTTVFKQDQPEDTDSVYEVFSRINTGGTKLSAQEIRSCVNYQENGFTSLLRELNEHPSWRKIYGGGGVSVRMKDQELILRFLALLHNRNHYKRPLTSFLNEFLARYREVNAGNTGAAFAEEFKSTIDLVLDAIGERAFRPERSLNAAVFDAVMVGLAERLRKSKLIDKGAIAPSYEALLADAGFHAAFTKSTADEEQVKTRVGLAVKAFEQLK